MELENQGEMEKGKFKDEKPESWEKERKNINRVREIKPFTPFIAHSRLAA